MSLSLSATQQLLHINLWQAAVSVAYRLSSHVHVRLRLRLLRSGQKLSGCGLESDSKPGPDIGNLHAKFDIRNNNNNNCLATTSPPCPFWPQSPPALTYFLVANYRLSRCVLVAFKVLLSRISFKFLSYFPASFPLFFSLPISLSFSLVLAYPSAELTPSALKPLKPNKS